MQSATLLHKTTLTGRGIFSGEPCKLTIEPADAGTGLVFVCNNTEIPVKAKYLQEQAQTTVLKRDDAQAIVTEHLLGALWASGIDHARMKIEGPEMPNQDGSAYPFYSALVKAGRVEMPATRPPIPFKQTIRVEDNHGSYLEYSPGEELWIDYIFTHPELGQQHISRRLERGDAVRDLLRARSFITEREAIAAIQAGIFKHNDPDVGLLIRDGKPHRRLRYKDEYARHKILDMLGDLYIQPYELTGRLTGFRSGHKLNRMLVRKILEITDLSEA